MNPKISALVLVALTATSWAQKAASQTASYCDDLKRVAALAMSQERFASVTGKPRQGNFSDATLTLTGWQDCALYGATTYTCDSISLNSAQAAEQAQADTLQQVKACLGEGWSESPYRGSANYVVLQSALRPVSITLSTDETDDNKHVVRLILFVRRE